MNECSLLSNRRAGILLHPTSLPGPDEFGDLGISAYKFVDFLNSAGMSAWQVLPLNPTHSDLSPYGAYSAHAGNPNLINLRKLFDKGWLKQKELNDKSSFAHGLRSDYLRSAYDYFIHHANSKDQQHFKSFKAQHQYWLDDYVLFECLRERYNSLNWNQWPEEYRNRHSEAIDKFSFQHQTELEFQKFLQFIFFFQWNELKQYANKNNIIIIGDIPIFVALDSADVWANRDYFSIDCDGNPIVVAGVPPDYFSETGQRWGNPHYRWDNLQRDNFCWWTQRIQTQHTLFDVIRIDHFRGLSQYWEIPASADTAQAGRWVSAPGNELLTTIRTSFPNTCLVAEDLGTITPDVDQLRDAFKLPGMRVLQFGFDGNEFNPHLPDNYIDNSIAYTATHDNDTTIGWYRSLSEDTKQYVIEKIDHAELPMPWPLIHAVLESSANTAIIPMQDILELDEKHRMNTPGTTNNQNWRWRFGWHQLKPETKANLNNLTKMYNRAQS